MRVSARLGVVALLSVVLGACNRKSAPSEVVGRDSAGVRIIDVASADQPLPWSFTEVRRLGGADSGPGAFTEANGYTVATDAMGLIYVLDPLASQVQVFDTTGHAVRSMGRKGGGPGEFQWPASVTVRPNGEVNVFDIGKQSLVRFAADGSMLPQLSLQPYGFPASQLRLTGDTLIMVVPRQTDNEKYRVMRLRMVSPRDSIEIARDSAPTPGLVMFSCVGMNIPAPFSSDLAWGSLGSRVAVTRRVPYVVDVYDQGRLVSSVRRNLPTITATTEHVSRLYPDGMKVKFGNGGECTITSREILEKLGAGGQVPLIKGIAFGADSTLWVERYTFADEEPSVDVFGSAGRYLGTLDGKSLPLGFAGPDLVLFPLEDEATGAKLVGIYRINRRPAG
ncbi:MAG: 6-bladed beta-propeller [Gemmatimonadota bacterium]